MKYIIVFSVILTEQFVILCIFIVNTTNLFFCVLAMVVVVQSVYRVEAKLKCVKWKSLSFYAFSLSILFFCVLAMVVVVQSVYSVEAKLKCVKWSHFMHFYCQYNESVFLCTSHGGVAVVQSVYSVEAKLKCVKWKSAQL